MLGGVRATRNLQVGENRDLRYIVAEPGFTPAFIQMGLACTASPAEAGAMEASAKAETNAEKAAKANGNTVGSDP